MPTADPIAMENNLLNSWTKPDRITGFYASCSGWEANAPPRRVYAFGVDCFEFITFDDLNRLGGEKTSPINKALPIWSTSRRDLYSWKLLSRSGWDVWRKVMDGEWTWKALVESVKRIKKANECLLYANGLNSKSFSKWLKRFALVHVRCDATRSH